MHKNKDRGGNEEGKEKQVILRDSQQFSPVSPTWKKGGVKVGHLGQVKTPSCPIRRGGGEHEGDGEEEAKQWDIQKAKGCKKPWSSREN